MTSGTQTFTTPLPADELPECWNQEERMKALFAPFRNRSTNPEDWHSKYKFWNELIKKWTSYNARCSFSLDDLRKNLKRNGISALCLPTVLEELYKNGEVMLESDFMKEPSKTWTGWSVDVFVKKPFNWSFSKIKNYVVEPVLATDQVYIHLATVKELAELILSVIDKKNENTLLSLADVTKYCIQKSSNERITENNIRLALIWLRNNQKATFKNYIEKGKDSLMVKISPNIAEEVNEADEAVHKLSHQEQELIKDIEQLEKEKNELISKAKTSKAKGLTKIALSFLRKSHALDASIKTRSAQLHNVQKYLTTIHNARYDAGTLEAYKAGYDALKMYENAGLTENGAIETMDKMAEILEEHNEVQAVMNQPIVDNNSDDELERELNELLESEEKPQKEKEKSKDESSSSLDLPNLSDLELADLPAASKPVTTQMSFKSFQ